MFKENLVNLFSSRPNHSKDVGKMKSTISGYVITMSKKVEIQGSFEVKAYPNGNTVYTFVLKRDMNKHFAKIKITYDKGNDSMVSIYYKINHR